MYAIRSYYDRHHALVLRQIELDVLDEAREVRHDQDGLLLVLAEESEHPAVRGREEGDGAASEGAVLLAERDEALHPVES